MYGVLFVCTGNICRSPTAEGVFRHVVEEAGHSENFLIDSAGTHGYHIGTPPDSRAISTAMARGVDISDLRGRRLHNDDFEKFDLILAMDSGHYSIMDRMQPQSSRAEISMFLDFSPGTQMADVPDPYYGDIEDFEQMLDLITTGVDHLFADLKEKVNKE